VIGPANVISGHLGSFLRSGLLPFEQMPAALDVDVAIPIALKPTVPWSRVGLISTIRGTLEADPVTHLAHRVWRPLMWKLDPSLAEANGWCTGIPTVQSANAGSDTGRNRSKVRQRHLIKSSAAPVSVAASRLLLSPVKQSARRNLPDNTL
jgi:hypothetical protein